ncbi:MAG: DUF190 domain-containing protein [Pseudomonadota bacterium]
MHEKRRLELIIERMALNRASHILEEAGVTGYTVLSAFAGFGGGSRWRRDGDLSHSQDMVVLIAICAQDKIDRALKDLHQLLDEQIGVLSVSAVEVLRPDRF